MLPDGAQEAFVNSNKICKVTTRDVGQAGERDVMMTEQKQSGTTSKEDAWKHQDCKKNKQNTVLGTNEISPSFPFRFGESTDSTEHH